MAVERKLVNERMRRVMVREYLKRETEKAGFGGVDIQRTPMGTRITLVAERPGFVIGRRGATIKKLTDDLTNRFQLDNPQIDVQEDSNPSLNAQIMAVKLAEALERGWHFRRAGHSTLRRIMESGAKGCQIKIGGKITGGRARMEKFTAGHIKHCGEPALQWMRLGYATARKKLGTIGVRVAIMDPNAKLPDEVTYAGEAGSTQVVPQAPAPAPAPAVPVEGEVGEMPAAPTGKRGGRLTDVEGIGKVKAKALEEAGFSDVESLREASEEDLATVLGEKLARKIKSDILRGER
ncbi:MAG TPA: 30S ribosomal protein S3 [Candidatus Thermoplasmatota archaeon]|nr:30S ribosomal protein S3 [Candidatus Thermoplasmatota archaeon]